MSTATPSLRKLPGAGWNWTGRGRLWQGEDHLLEVTSLIVVENYRRFFFHETKAFVVLQTNARFVWALLEGIFGAICAAAAGIAGWYGVSNSTEEWHTALYVVAGIFGVIALASFGLLAINLLLGPSCRCHVLTTTGWQALNAPLRLGPALRVQESISPLIDAAQNNLPAAVEAEVS